MAPIVRVDDVTKTYGSSHTRALAHLSLNFELAEFVALMGPSGCGKSTLLNIIAGIDEPNAGRVYVDGKDLFALNDTERTKLRADKVGFIFQFFNLLSTLTVMENVALPLSLTGNLNRKESAKLAVSMLERVGLAAKANLYPSQLSGGEMQRTAIARALVHSPRIVLADEPTGNLDTENGQSVLALLRAANLELGVTIIMATHSLEAASCAGRIVHMRDGKLVSQEAVR